MRNIDKLITEFLDYLENGKGRTWRTVRNYDYYLRRFSGWLKNKKISDPGDINAQVIRRYREWLKKVIDPINKKTLKQNTRNYHLIAIRAFLKYLAKKKIKTLLPQKIELVQIEKVKRVYLRKIELEKLFEAPALVKQDKVLFHRDRAILELIYCTGMKVSEVAGLERSVIKKQKKVGFVINKGEKKERKIVLSNQAAYWIKEYLKKRKDDNEFLFISHDRANQDRNDVGLSPRSIERTLEKYGKVAGLEKRVTPQVLRNSYAINLMKLGTDIEVVKNKLGHSALSTTQTYYL